MDWASAKSEIRPSFNQLAVDKKTVVDSDVFSDFVALYGLKIIQEEPSFYILDGPEENLEEFYVDWNWK